MPAGIGLPLMFSQAYPAADAKAPGTPLEDIAGVPGLLADAFADPQAMVAAGVAPPLGVHEQHAEPGAPGLPPSQVTRNRALPRVPPAVPWVRTGRSTLRCVQD